MKEKRQLANFYFDNQILMPPHNISIREFAIKAFVAGFETARQMASDLNRKSFDKEDRLCDFYTISKRKIIKFSEDCLELGEEEVEE